MSFLKSIYSDPGLIKLQGSIRLAGRSQVLRSAGDGQEWVSSNHFLIVLFGSNVAYSWPGKHMLLFVESLAITKLNLSLRVAVGMTSYSNQQETS